VKEKGMGKTRFGEGSREYLLKQLEEPVTKKRIAAQEVFDLRNRLYGRPEEPIWLSSGLSVPAIDYGDMPLTEERCEIWRWVTERYLATGTSPNRVLDREWCLIESVRSRINKWHKPVTPEMLGYEYIPRLYAGETNRDLSPKLVKPVVYWLYPIDYDDDDLPLKWSLGRLKWKQTSHWADHLHDHEYMHTEVLGTSDSWNFNFGEWNKAEEHTHETLYERAMARGIKCGSLKRNDVYVLDGRDRFYMSYDEMSSETGENESTLRTRYERAWKKLCDIAKELEPEKTGVSRLLQHQHKAKQAYREEPLDWRVASAFGVQTPGTVPVEGKNQDWLKTHLEALGAKLEASIPSGIYYDTKTGLYALSKRADEPTSKEHVCIGCGKPPTPIFNAFKIEGGKKKQVYRHIYHKSWCTSEYRASYELVTDNRGLLGEWTRQWMKNYVNRQHILQQQTWRCVKIPKGKLRLTTLLKLCSVTPEISLLKSALAGTRNLSLTRCVGFSTALVPIRDIGLPIAFYWPAVQRTATEMSMSQLLGIVGMLCERWHLPIYCSNMLGASYRKVKS
jgi:hypothetical protein